MNETGTWGELMNETGHLIEGIGRKMQIEENLSIEDLKYLSNVLSICVEIVDMKIMTDKEQVRHDFAKDALDARMSRLLDRRDSLKNGSE